LRPKRFGFFGLVVADAADEERLTVECCPTCRVLPFVSHEADDELWCVLPLVVRAAAAWRLVS
jgi:hypothetical protein